MAVIYDLKINNEANALLKNAQSTWAANPNEQDGQDATAYIMQINPKANSYANAAQLLNTINTKLIADERERKRRQAEYEKRQQIIDAENAKKLVAIGSKIRNLTELGLTETVSTRLLVNAATLIKSGLPKRLSTHIAIVEPLTDDLQTVQSLKDLCNLMI